MNHTKPNSSKPKMRICCVVEKTGNLSALLASLSSIIMEEVNGKRAA